jgi:UDP-N-acetyl-D-mannosaminuronic acid dehydrogenase
MLASHGNQVMGTDYNHKLVKQLSDGKVTFKEDGLAALLKKAVGKNVAFSTEYQQAEVYIISVPTPYDRESKKVDPGYVISAVTSVMEICPDDAIIVIESTIPPGTIDKYIRPILNGKNISIAHSPERIIPGNMIHELSHNARTIGADDEAVGNRVKEIYATFCQGDIILTDIRSAEMIKVVENTFRDVNIAYANELSRICHESGLDVYEVIRIANTHPRVDILQPGPGVGGHCISVDPWFLVGDYPDSVNIIKTAREVNDGQPGYILQRVIKLEESLHIMDVSRIGFYGITYKADVDDTRESPMLQMFGIMGTRRDYIRVYDPYVERDIFLNQYHDLGEFLDGLELLVIMVGHSEIKTQQNKLAKIKVFDTCHFLSGPNVISL